MKKNRKKTGKSKVSYMVNPSPLSPKGIRKHSIFIPFHKPENSYELAEPVLKALDGFDYGWANESIQAAIMVLKSQSEKFIYKYVPSSKVKTLKLGQQQKDSFRECQAKQQRQGT